MRHLYGLLGESLKHSISPKIHSLIFNELNIQGCYHLFEVEKNDLKTAVKGLKVLGANGVNVTIPYKIPLIGLVDELSPEAEKIGSINTLAFSNDRITGYNTDYYGFGMMLNNSCIYPANKKAVVLGSGGAAKSVIQYLLDNSVSDLTMVSRDVSALKAHNSFKDYNLISYKELELLNSSDIIINCTPCGMYPNSDSSPVSKNIVSKFSAAVDLIYNPSETLFLRYARENNLNYTNGLYMLVGQAVSSQEIWHKTKISSKIIDKIYSELR